MGDAVVRFQTVVVNVIDMPRARDFWSAVLGVGVARDIGDFFCWLEPQQPGGVAVALQLVGDPKQGRNRVHLDTSVDDLDEARRRIEALGGSFVEEHDMGGFRWFVMADPEGNELCIAAG